MSELRFNIQMFATSGNDTITNNSAYTNISGYGGNDNITNYGKYSTIYGDDGADNIYNEAGGVKIYGGNGNDYIYNSTDSYYTINNSYGYVTMDGGAGNDTIYSYDPYVSINGGAGNDYIQSSNWSGVTIKGGTGNDTIYSYDTVHSFLYQYSNGDGNDIIYNWSSTDTLNLGGAYYSKSISGSNVVLTVGTGRITLSGASNKTVNITNGTLSVIGGQYVDNTNSYTTIYGTSYNDTIYNNGNSGGDSSKIYTYAGNDSIYSYDADSATIDAGEGNDTVTGYYYSSSINGGAGADLLRISGSYFSNTVRGGDGNDTVYANGGLLDGGAGNDRISLMSSGSNETTIKGGTGNDIIYGDSVGSYGILYQYANGDGNDIIYNWSSNDTLNLSGATYTKAVSNSNIILGVGTSSITLSGANGKTVNITNGTLSSIGGEYFSNYSNNNIINGTAYNDTVYNSADYVTIKTGAGNDSIYNGGYNGDYSSVDAGDGDDTIYSLFGDYVSINGGAGNDKILGSYNSSKLYGGAGNDLISLEGGYEENTISGGEGNDTIYGHNLSNHGILYQYSNGDGVDYIYNFKSNDTLSIAGSYSTARVGNDFVYYVGSGAVYLKNYTPPTTPSGLITNTVSSATVNGTSSSDTIKNTGGSSKIYAGAGNDSIYNTSASYVTIDAGDGNDTISNVYNGGGDYVSINAGAGNDSVYTDWIYGSTINGGTGADTISIYRGANNSINGGADNDRINLINSYGVLTVRGGAGNDSIYGDTISSYGVVYQYSNGDGVDYIYNFKSDDTLNILGNYSTARVGNDFVYYVGSGAVYLKNYIPPTPTVAAVSVNNTVYGATVNGTAADDTIKNTGGSSKIYAGAGNDSIYNTSASYVTIDAGDGNDTISNVYNGGGDYVSINAGAGNDSVYTDYIYSSTINGGTGADTISIYRGANNSINGGADNDRINLVNSYGVLTVRGGAGNDTVYGDTVNSYAVVYQYSNGDGNDVIYNFHQNDTVSGVISSIQSGNNIILRMQGEGSITLAGVGALSPFSEGNDSYSNSTSNTLLNALAGNDTIINSATKVTIEGGAGNDSISNSANYTTLKGDAGADTVYNYDGDYAYIDLGDGNDSIYASDNDNVTVYAGAGSDTISGMYYNSKIYGGEGNDILTIGGGGSSSYYANTVDGGTGEDSIVVSYGGSINGGEGNDTVRVNNGTASYVRTVRGGTGNDVIYGVSGGSSYGTRYEYSYGDGSDVIYNWNNNDTISIAGTSQYSTTKSGSNFVVSVIGSGAMTLSGASNKTVNIKGGTLININPYNGVSISSSKSNTTLNGTGNNDTIKNIYNSSAGGGDMVLINAGAGNDTIYNNYGYYVTIDAGAGNDTITSYRGSSNSINGGAGADIISLSSSYGLTVVKGGTGNDTVYGDAVAHLYQYANGDGNDIIYGHNNSDAIEITSGAYMTVKSGSNVIVNITSGANSSVATGSITLNGASSNTLNIIGTKVNTPDPIPPVPSAVTQKEVIQKFMGVLDTVTSDGVGRLNQAVSVASGGYFSNIYSAVSQMISDCQNNADDFLVNYCGINLTNTDTGAISGSDAGGSVTKTSNSIVPESGSLINFTGNSFQVNGLTIQLASFDYNMNPYNMSYSSLSSNAQRYIWQALYTWWAKGALNLIAESYGNNFSYTSASSASINKMYFGFERENSSTLATTYRWGNSQISKTAMTVNMSNYDNIIIGDSDGRRSNNSYSLDRVLAHEFTHAVMGVNINYFGNLPKFIKEGMAELTHGADDDREYSIRYLANNPSALSSALSLANGNSYSYAGGYMFLRYLAKQSSEHGTYGISDMSSYISSSNNASATNITAQRNVTVKNGTLTVAKTFDEDMIDLAMYSTTVTKVDASKLTEGVMIVGNERNNSVKSGKGDDTISGNTGNDTITGGTGNDLIMGDAGNDNLKGEAGNDTLSGGSGKNTLTGSAGNDVFIYNGGTDLITDYEAGKDKIKIVDDVITSSSISGSNIILNIGQGNITVKGGKGKALTIIDKDDNETTKVYPLSDSSSAATAVGVSVKSAVLTAAKTFTGTSIDLADYATNVTKVNATAVTTPIEIKGNSSANSIKGGTGADTLYGGDGKDTIFGGNGNDIIFGDAGDDKISGDAGNDTLNGGAGNDSLGGGAGADSISGNAGNDTLVGGAGADTLYGGDGNDKISGDADNDILNGGAGNDSLGGGAGNDTLYGGTGADTLTGGAGKDIFIYEGGNDLITDYKAGDDKIKITSGAVTGVSISSSNVILKTASGNVTVKSGKGKDITLIDYRGNETTKKYTASTSAISARVSENLWFMEDNFISGDTQLDSISKITADNYSAGNIETYDYNSLDYLQIASSSQNSLNNK